MRRGRYSLERRTDCILESKGIPLDARRTSEPDPEPEPDLFLEDLTKNLVALNEEHAFQSPDFLATLPEKESKYKVG